MQTRLRRTHLTGLLVAIASLAVFIPAIALADEGKQHIAITPSSTDILVVPGGQKTNTLSVVNQGADGFSVKVSVEPYHVEGTAYDPQFTQLPGTVDASQWVHLQTTQISALAPGTLVNVDYSVQVPASTAPGGYYAVVFAETTPEDTSGGVVAHNRVGEILYMTVEGPVKTSGKVLADKLTTVNTTGEVPISLLVQNTGGIHFKTTVTATVKNMFGKQVFKQTAVRYVLPQTERKVTLTWTDGAPFGLYRISRQATSPSGTVLLPSKLVLIVQPWLLVGFLIVLVVAVAGLIRRRLSKHTGPPKKG